MRSQRIHQQDARFDVGENVATVDQGVSFVRGRSGIFVLRAVGGKEASLGFGREVFPFRVDGEIREGVLRRRPRRPLPRKDCTKGRRECAAVADDPKDDPGYGLSPDPAKSRS